RAVVDDAAAARVLVLHQAERGARAQEGAGQVDVDDLAPFLDGELVDRYRPRARPRVVEQDVEPAELIVHGGEQGVDRGRIGDVGRCDERTVARAGLGGGGLEGRAPPARGACASGGARGRPARATR